MASSTSAFSFETIDSKILKLILEADLQFGNLQSIFAELKSQLSPEEITRLIVEVKMNDPWNEEIENFWIQMGRMADENGIIKWGIAQEDLKFGKKLRINYLMKGGIEGPRSYLYYISDKIDYVVEWATTDVN